MPYYTRESQLPLAEAFLDEIVNNSFHKTLREIENDLGVFTERLCKLVRDVELDNSVDLIIKHPRFNAKRTSQGKVEIEVYVDIKDMGYSHTGICDVSDMRDTTLRMFAENAFARHWMGSEEIPRKDEDLSRYGFEGDCGWKFMDRIDELGEFAPFVEYAIGSRREAKDIKRNLEYEFGYRLDALRSLGVFPEYASSGFRVFLFLGNEKTPPYSLSIGEISTRSSFGSTHRIVDGEGIELVIGKNTDDIDDLWRNFSRTIAEHWAEGRLNTSTLRPEMMAKAEKTLLEIRTMNNPPEDPVENDEVPSRISRSKGL